MWWEGCGKDVVDIGQSKVKTGNKLSPAGSTKSSPGLDVIGRRAGTVQAGQTFANLFLPTVRRTPLKTTQSVKNYKHLKNDSNHENPGVFSNS